MSEKQWNSSLQSDTYGFVLCIHLTIKMDDLVKNLSGLLPQNLWRRNFY